MDGSREPLLTNSLVLSAASPFLCTLLSSLNYCDGCSSRKTIILAEEQKDIVEGLLHLLHAKYLKEDSSNLIHKGPEFEELCRRLTIEEIPPPSPVPSQPSRPATDEEGDRNDEDIEIPQLHAAEAPIHESQNILASKDAATYRKESSWFMAPVCIPFEKLAQSSRAKVAEFQTSKPRPHAQNIEVNLPRREISPPSPFSSEPSIPVTDEKGDRNNEDIEMPQLHADEAPSDESQNILASEDAATYAKEPCLFLAQSSELSRPAPDEEGDRNDEDVEMQPQSHVAKAPTDQPKKLLAPMNTTTCSNKPSVSSAQRRSIRQRYPVHRIQFKSAPSSLEFQTSKRRKLVQKKRHRYNCGNCLGCARDEDCGECDFCLDKPKFGGPGTKKQKCELRWCKFKNSRINPHLGKLKQKDTKKKKKKGLFTSRDQSISLKCLACENTIGKKCDKEKIERGANARSGARAATQQNPGGADKTKPRKATNKKKVREFFITAGTKKKAQLHDSECGSRQHLKCYICGKGESGRSHLYGHYARSHFRTQLIERIGAKRRNCEEHNVMLKGEASRAAHFGRVHNMVQSCKISNLTKSKFRKLNFTPRKVHKLQQIYHLH